jgi:TolB protein
MKFIRTSSFSDKGEKPVSAQDRPWAKPAFRWFWLLVLVGLMIIFGASPALINFFDLAGDHQNRPSQVQQPRILYIALDEAGNDQLYLMNPTGGQPVQLTQAPFGIVDYAPSPEAAVIAYTVLREDGGSDLWTVNADGSKQQPLLVCPGVMCSGAVWTPNGQRLIYEHRILGPGGEIGPPRLWWFDPASSETSPVFADEQITGYGAAWSPDGLWLSYVVPGNEGVRIFNVQDGRDFQIPTQTGGQAVWSPVDNVLLVADFRPQDEKFTVHLLQVDLTQGKLVDLSGEGQPVEDTSPAWSPDGAWVAFTRKPAGVSMGKQIWLMRADGREARYLTADPAIHHGLPAWSPDGRTLVFQRFPLKEIEVLPGIWLLDVGTGRVEELVTSGRQPVWWP